VSFIGFSPSVNLPKWAKLWFDPFDLRQVKAKMAEDDKRNWACNMRTGECKVEKLGLIMNNLQAKNGQNSGAICEPAQLDNHSWAKGT